MEPRIPPTPSCAALLAALLLCSGPSGSRGADNFSFSSEAAKDKAQAQADGAARSEAMRQLVPAVCRQRLRNKKILLLIAERSGTQWQTSQERYGPLFRVIESRLRALGTRTYSQEQIKAEIAQAEVDAYFKNDPDAALAASKRLGANYVMRGSLSSESGVNAVVQVSEVTVDVNLTLSGSDGRVLSEVTGHSGSYSGSDTLGTAVALMREQADPLLAKLYNDYCRLDAGR